MRRRSMNSESANPWEEALQEVTEPLAPWELMEEGNEPDAEPVERP
jgi:hypothetical protein